MISERTKNLRRAVSSCANLIEDYLSQNCHLMNAREFDFLSRTTACLDSIANEVFNGLTTPDCECTSCRNIPHGCTTDDYLMLTLRRTMESMEEQLKVKTLDISSKALISKVVSDLRAIHDSVELGVVNDASS